MTSISTTHSTVQALNDQARTSGPFSGHARWMLTPGVIAKGDVFVQRAITSVQAFTAFTADNDPYGEHDFGSIDLLGERLFWKIDCYDPSLRYGSESPADASGTRRVLTIMLAEDY